MQLSSIVKHMGAWAPNDSAEAWDNVGLQLAPNGDCKVKKILIALDVDAQVLEKISQQSIDLVITHHPLIFKGLSSIQTVDPVGKSVIALIQNNCNLLCAHTNLDKAENGVNHALLEHFGLPASIGLPFDGDIGLQVDIEDSLTNGGLTKEQVENFHKKLAHEANQSRIVGVGDLKNLKRVGFCGGSGKSLLPQVYNSHIDLFITGELGYHDEVYIEIMGKQAMLMGHRESEVPVLVKIADYLQELSGEFDIEVMN